VAVVCVGLILTALVDPDLFPRALRQLDRRLHARGRRL